LTFTEFQQDLFSTLGMVQGGPQRSPFPHTVGSAMRQKLVGI